MTSTIQVFPYGHKLKLDIKGKDRTVETIIEGDAGMQIFNFWDDQILTLQEIHEKNDEIIGST